MALQSQSKDAQVLKLKDGRDLGYAVYGNPSSSSAPIIFYLHGFPGARVEAKLWLESSLSPAIDAQCIGIDRPGMGLSTFQPNRKMLDFPADLIELAEHLKAEKFHIIGVSGGAPYALACAKQISKNKLISVALCSGLYPGSRDGMLWALRALLFVGYWAPTALMATLFDSKFGRPARDPDPHVTEDFLMAEMQGRPKEDLQCFENTELKTTIADSMRKAFEQGGMGPAWDFRLFSEV
jgi:pimeloyl-ACP methyl ester carboxylesterase